MSNLCADELFSAERHICRVTFKNGARMNLTLGSLASGALIAGVLQVATQIDDPVIGFIGRLSAVVLLFFFAAAFFSSEMHTFTERLWSGTDFYH